MKLINTNKYIGNLCAAFTKFVSFYFYAQGGNKATR